MSEQDDKPVALPERMEPHSHLAQQRDWKWCEGWNACLDEIAKLGPLYPRPVQGEPVAWIEKADVANIAAGALWGGTVWGRPSPTGLPLPERVPVYTHADPAEVKRLRERCAELEADFAGMAKVNDALINQRGEAWMERDTLRAENERLRAGFYQQVTDEDLKKISDYMANPDLPKGAFLRQDAYDLANMTTHMVREVQASRAHLAETHKLLKWFASCADVRQVGAVAMQRSAALSASAETSAPKCKTCHDQGEVFVRKGDVHCGMQTEPEPVMAACPECTEPSAPLCAEGVHEFVPFRSECVKCGEPYSAEPRK